MATVPDKSGNNPIVDEHIPSLREIIQSSNEPAPDYSNVLSDIEASTATTAVTVVSHTPILEEIRDNTAPVG